MTLAPDHAGIYVFLDSVTVHHAELELPPKHRFVYLVLGRSPELIPVTEPGTYTAATMRLGLPWPRLVASVPLDCVHAWLRLAPSQVEALVQRSAQASRLADTPTAGGRH